MTEQNKKLMGELAQCINSSTSEADAELLDVMTLILKSKLLNNQKRLLLYFLHSELLLEIEKEIKLRNKLEEKISSKTKTRNSDTQKLEEITRTATELEKIRDIIGGYLYDVVATDDATDDQIEIYSDRFLYHRPWKGESSTSRKVTNFLRGFKIKFGNDK